MSAWNGEALVGHHVTTHTIYLIGGTEDETAVFREAEAGDLCVLTCSYRGKQIEASEQDFFEALCKVRSEMEAEGLIPFCYGASLNVYPSAMSRQMSAGRAAYRMTSGKQATKQDLVQIFDEGPDIIPASLESQRKHFDEWLNSLG
jgi:hypothetical protein